MFTQLFKLNEIILNSNLLCDTRAYCFYSYSGSSFVLHTLRRFVACSGSTCFRTGKEVINRTQSAASRHWLDARSNGRQMELCQWLLQAIKLPARVFCLRQHLCLHCQQLLFTKAGWPTGIQGAKRVVRAHTNRRAVHSCVPCISARWHRIMAW